MLISHRRFITPIFLHAGILHLALNLFAQLRFGIMLERKWGIVKFVILYFVSGIGGVLMSCLIEPKSLSVGASGAIMGLMGRRERERSVLMNGGLGALLSETILTWHKTDPNVRKIMLFQLIFAIVVTFMFSFWKYVDFGAHFGGCLVGMMIGALYFGFEYDKPTVRRILPIFSIALIFIYFIVGFVVFYVVIKV